MIIGWGTKTKKECYLGRYICQNCRGFTDYYLLRQYTYFSIFFIPILRITKGYYIGCGNCLGARQIEKDAYLKMREEYATFPVESRIVQAFLDIRLSIKNGYQPQQKEELKKSILSYCNFDGHDEYLDNLIDDLYEIEGEKPDELQTKTELQ